MAKAVHKNTMRPIAVDLFAGAGGMSLGFEQAGFDVAAAIEIDPIHACIHHFNFPGGTVIPRSVKNLSGDDIRKIAGIQGKVHVVIGGAPCQGFSMIGKRALDDPRNSLVKDFVRIVTELDADYFVFENVKGLTVGTHRTFLEELIETFESHGYAVRLPWSVLNAVSYGVPQDRKRLFLLGARKGLKCPLYPTPLTSRAGLDSEITLPAGLTPLPADQPLALGSPSLLAMEMSRAAAYWEVDTPIQKRDRKSGEKMRSQSQTEADRLSRSSA